MSFPGGVPPNHGDTVIFSVHPPHVRPAPVPAVREWGPDHGKENTGPGAGQSTSGPVVQLLARIHISLQFQRMLRTFFHASHAQDTFRRMFLLAGIAGDFHIHRAYLFALAAGDAFRFVHLDTEKGQVTRRF